MCVQKQAKWDVCVYILWVCMDRTICCCHSIPYFTKPLVYPFMTIVYLGRQNKALVLSLSLLTCLFPSYSLSLTPFNGLHTHHPILFHIGRVALDTGFAVPEGLVIRFALMDTPVIDKKIYWCVKSSLIQRGILIGSGQVGFS